jgi:hypothetical protein
VVDEFRLRILKRSFILHRPLYRNIRGLIKDRNVLEWGLARCAKICIVDEAVSPTNEYADSFEAA